MSDPFADLPALESPCSVSKQQRQDYARDGHVVLRGLATREEVGAYRPFIREILEDAAARRRTEGRVGGYGAFFTQVTNLWRVHDGVLRFVIAKRFARVAAGLLGAQAVRLYHDQALFKPPGGKGTPWHQDQVYWPLDTPRTVTMWMPLMDVPRAMGTMVFACGSHMEGPLTDLAISEDSDTFFAQLVKDRGYTLASYDLAAGDATFHSGWTAHATHPNTGSANREVMTIIYYADGARIIEPESTMRRVDMEAFHPGQYPGEHAASVLNPILYSGEE
jgi:ectoine hydroxylase-related dioxygenase (phytanoyl-CoA dioxygenase family)